MRPRRLLLRSALTAAELTALDLGEPFRARYQAPYVVMHRSDLLAILYDACQAAGVGLQSGPGRPRRDRRRGRRHRRMRRRHQLPGRGRDRGRRPALRRPRAVHRRPARLLGLRRLPRHGPDRRGDRAVTSWTRWWPGSAPTCTSCSTRCAPGRSTTRSRCSAARSTRPIRGSPTASGAARASWTRPSGLLPAGARGDRVSVAGPVVADVRPGAAGRLDPRPDRAARRRGAPDAAVPGPGRLPGHRGRRRAGPDPGRLPRPGPGRQSAGPVRGKPAPAHAARVQRTARTWGDIWHVRGVGALLRDELFRRRPADDYSYTDWLYGPSCEAKFAGRPWVVSLCSHDCRRVRASRQAALTDRHDPALNAAAAASASAAAPHA